MLTEEDKQWIGAQLDRLDVKIDGVETRLEAKIERVETSLLTEFHKWASPIEMRVKSHSAAIRATDLDVEIIAERVKKLEGGADAPH